MSFRLPFVSLPRAWPNSNVNDCFRALRKTAISLQPPHALPSRPMKTSYIFGAILLCSIAGALVGSRATKTVLLVGTGVLSAYGLFRILG